VRLEGKRIFLYGASTRGSTLLQTLAMSEGFFTGAAERDQSKWGRQTVGTWVPIVSEETARKEAQVFFVLPHHFRRGIELREKKWLADGGELIFPLPRPVSVTSDGVTDLLTGMKAEELAIPMEG
jgi:NDP-4-keto-2,6-dideoxyhexose 3-C-methyltransferase